MASRIYGLLLGLIILGTANFAGVDRSPAATNAEETWTIPGAGSTAGVNNTRFVSDLALTNPGGSLANVTISFVGPGGLPARPLTLAAGATTVYRNVLDSLWSASGLVGAISVRSDQPLVLRARTYNTAATGTFGVALPVYASGQLFEEGQTADSLWVQQDLSASSGFRTNVGVVFPDATGGDATVTFFDASGGTIGTLAYSSASAGFQQQSTASIAPAGLSVGRAQISVSRGHAAGYAVGVDNVTGDTSLYPFEALPAGVQDVVVNGVARLNGRNNTFFRTDARLYNPTPDDATVTLRFHAAGNSNPTPQSATVNVPAGRVLEVVDVLGSILNAPVGSGGAVRFTADQPVAILCRTSNVDPQGVQPGTFGAQQHPVPLASFLSSADAGAVVTAIRQDASFRTNVGFTAGPDGAEYRLTLKSAQGAVIGTTTGSLGPFGWTQPSVADLFPGTAIPADATLLAEVTFGTVDVYDASLDNASGDLVVTPIAPVPAAIPSSALIGPAGGSIRSADGRLTLRVPAGALAAPTTLSIAAVANTAPNAIGSAYSVTPVDLPFARPAQLVLAYSTADLRGTGAGALGIASQDGGSWLGILGGSVDPVARTLRVPIFATSPGNVPAGAGLVPQRAAPGNFGPGSVTSYRDFMPYGSVVLNLPEYSVEEEGTVEFEPIFTGPSATQQGAPGFAPLRVFIPPPTNLLTRWFVNNSFTDTGVGTISPTTGRSTIYTAPRCAPVSPVTISVALITSGPFLILDARVRVIPARWTISIFYRLETPCVGFPFSVDFCRSHVFSNFLIRNGQVTQFRPGPDHSDTRTEPSRWCPGFTGTCEDPVLSTITDLELTNVTGSLVDQESLSPAFSLQLSANIPGDGAFVSFTCQGNPAPPLPIIHAAHPPVFPVRISYLDLKNYFPYPLPFGSEEVEVVLTRISCDLIADAVPSSCN